MLQQNPQNLNPNVSVDCVIFAFDGSKLNVLLIERDNGDLALPGDLINNQENLDQAAERVLSELTHVKGITMQQFGSFADPDRLTKPADVEWLSNIRLNPSARVITVGYFALTLMKNIKAVPDSFARSVVWHPLYEYVDLAFDHNIIVDNAINALRWELKTYPVGFELLPKKFTLRELRSLYEAILNKGLDKRNFYKKILGSGLLKETGEKEKQVAHKPAKLYQVNKNKLHQIKNMVQLW